MTVVRVAHVGLAPSYVRKPRTGQIVSYPQPGIALVRWDAGGQSTVPAVELRMERA